MENHKKEKVCAFTGHRSLEADFKQADLKEKIENLIKDGVIVFLSGVATGFDIIAAKMVISLKKEYPFIKLIACIPCLNQEKYFSDKQREEYYAVLEQADEKHVLSDRYYKGCMQKRNRYMADKADILTAYLKKNEGGTAYTVRYFEKNYPEKPIVFI